MSLQRITAIATALAALGGSSVRAQGVLTSAQTSDIEVAIRDALASEQAVFEANDCEAAVAFFTVREPRIYVDGQFRPHSDVLRMACGAMPAGGAETARTLRSHAINVLSESAAYSVSDYDVQSGNDRQSSLTVTRIWKKVDGDWLIAHLQQSAGGQ